MTIPNKFVVIDTETTGTDKILNDPVQIAGVFKLPGIVHPMHNKEFNILSRPINPENICEDALKVIGKSEEEIMEYPNAFTARGKFQNLCFKVVNRYNKNDKMFIVGYNVQFDADMLREWFFKTGDKYFGSLFFPYVVDILSVAKNLWAAGKLPGITNLQLETVFKYLYPNREFKAHDAMADVNASIAVMIGFRKNFGCVFPEID